MAERAHPDSDGFQSPWSFRLRRGFIPWLSYRPRPYRKELLKRYQWANNLCKGMKVLDAPCGMGWGTSLLRKARERIGIDLSEDAIKDAEARFGNHGRFLQASMEDLPFGDGEFDTVICLEGIEHVPISVGKAFMAEAHRVLRQGGQLLISSPYCQDGSHSGNPYHIHEYQPAEITALISTFFDIQESHEATVEHLTIRYIRAIRRDLAKTA